MSMKSQRKNLNYAIFEANIKQNVGRIIWVVPENLFNLLAMNICDR